MDDTTLSAPSPSALVAGGPLVGLTERLRALRDHLSTGLVERDVAIRLALLSALAGEHLLLVGPPGTAKSVLARRLKLAFSGAPYFERLLTKFSVPEELFGPLSIKGLEEDRYERQTDRYLPTAAIAFLDEIFKANSAILNALLTLLNEREFDNGAQRGKTPLISVIGASNELIESEELDALFDRFLLRLHVGPVSDAGFPALLALRGEASPELPSALPLSTAELQAIQAAATDVKVPADLLKLIGDLRAWCGEQNIVVSDRRWRKVVKLLQVSALTNGRTEASIWDAWLLQHCIWSAPEDRQKVYDWYAARVGATAAMNPEQLTQVVAAWEGQLKNDQDARAQTRDPKGAPLFELNGKPTTNPKCTRIADRDGAPLYLSPPNGMLIEDHHKPAERTNGGEGWTLEELDAHWYMDVYQNRFRHSRERSAYLADEANRLTVPADLKPFLEPLRHPAAHIEGCKQELSAIKAEVVDYQRKLTAHISSLNASIQAHLWVMPEFSGPALESLNATAKTVDTLGRRVDALVAGFGQLPQAAPTPTSKLK